MGLIARESTTYGRLISTLPKNHAREAEGLNWCMKTYLTGLKTISFILL